MEVLRAATMECTIRYINIAFSNKVIDYGGDTAGVAIVASQESC